MMQHNEWQFEHTNGIWMQATVLGEWTDPIGVVYKFCAVPWGLMEGAKKHEIAIVRHQTMVKVPDAKDKPKNPLYFGYKDACAALRTLESFGFTFTVRTEWPRVEVEEVKPVEPVSCFWQWSTDAEMWETDCGDEFCFAMLAPGTCPNCKKKIEEVKI